MNASVEPESGAGRAREKLIGTWRLVAHQQELLDTGEIQYPRGRDPDGFLTYVSDGRFHVLNAPRGRAKPKGLSPTDDEALALFKGVTAYAGTYSFVGDGELIHHVEISLNESWAGTDQHRRFTLDGDTLTIVSGPLFSPWDGKHILATMTYQRLR